MRAWNSTEHSAHPELPSDAAVDIAAAHLFGLFRNLRLPNSARDIALSVEMRSEDLHYNDGEVSRRQSDVSARADDEMRELNRIDDPLAPGQTLTVGSIATDFGTVDFEIAAPLITFARNLRRARNSDLAAEALQQADAQLDDWHRLQSADRRDHSDVILPFGVRMRLPANFDQG